MNYHDGVCATDVSIPYRLPDDWLFLESVDQYEGSRESRRVERLSAPPLDARGILYGRPLLEFIARSNCLLSDQFTSAAECVGSVEVEGVLTAPVVDPALAGTATQTLVSNSSAPSVGKVEHQPSDDPDDDALRTQISLLHASWLMTPRDDLRAQSPREVLLARQDFIDYDLHTRSMQWSMQGEGPPCLGTESSAYRFAGFGTHEWVIYYDLVRHLLWCARKVETGSNKPVELESEITRLEKLKTEWLEQPLEDYDGRIPALLIENERIRLPIAMRVHDMVIDDDCPVCQMMANDAELGMEVGFWHLDGAHMDDDFAFSELRTREEWEAQRKEWEEFTEKFNREWEDRQQRERSAGVEHVEMSSDISNLNRITDEEGLIDSNKPAS